MRNKKHIPKVFLGVFICFLGLNVVFTNTAKAGKFYPNGLAECISSSGHSNIYSVTNYACQKAIQKNQNACASWLGSPSSSTSTTVYAAAATGTVPVALWGMCTDTANTSSRMDILNADGSITCGGSCNFTRSGTWGSPSSKSATIDVAKFIQGAALKNGLYCRTVVLDREHGGNTSAGLDFSEICLSLGVKPPDPPQDTPETLCRRWAPSSFTSADMWHGTTTVEVKIKNLATRFGNTGFGDWGDGVIYAMPTDEIQWVECYYGGTPGTGQTEVSSVNGAYKGYVEPLRDDWCYNSSWGSVWYPGSYYPWTNVGSTPLSMPYFQLYTRVQPWQNQWNTYGDGYVVKAGDTQNGFLSYNVFTNTSAVKRNGHETHEGYAGRTLTESAQAGQPMSVNISRENPSHSIYKSYYETTETDWSRPKTCTKTRTWTEYVWDRAFNIWIPIEKKEEYTITDGWECGWHTKQVPHYDGYSCTNRYEREIRSAYVSMGPDDDSASVLIPYNFLAYTGVSLSSGEVFAGETVQVEKVWTQIAPKSNAVTKASYATQAPGAQLKLAAFVVSSDNVDSVSDSLAGRTTGDSNACGMVGGAAKQCMEYNSKGGLTLNSGGDLSGSYDGDPGDMAGTYDAFDASAGDYMCFVSLVYPASSGVDTQMGTGGDGQWRYSDPSCAVIAKRPTFQVWGADMYSNGSINAATSTKRNIYYAYRNLGETFTTRNGYGKNTFGSWVEEGLVLGGGASTNNLASGAAMGNNNDAKRAYAGNMGDFCNTLSPLTMSNYNNGCRIGSSGLTVTMSNEERKTSIDYWVKQSQDTASGARIDYSNSGAIYGMTVPIRTTKIYEVGGTATIYGNIVYQGHDAAGSYNTLRDIPKVIIYADNVNISCGVTNVDAIIITREGGTVNTCAGAGNEDDPARSNPLKIFGMVIADRVDLGRTYGQAAWDGRPANGQQAGAEVFDFDSSILMWSEFMASSAETDTMQIVYQNEIAPRY